MKKIIVILLVLSLVALCGCKEQTVPANQTATKPGSSNADPETPTTVAPTKPIYSDFDWESEIDIDDSFLEENETTPVDPQVTEPSASDPSEPKATDPSGSEPQGTTPQGSEPQATEPEATEPSATEPAPTTPNKPGSTSKPIELPMIPG